MLNQLDKLMLGGQLPVETTYDVRVKRTSDSTGL